MSRINKKLCILLCTIVLSSSLFASCADNTDAGDTDPSKQTNNSQISESENSSDESETDIYSVLPDGDYGGYTFNILNNISNFAYTTMDADGETGEVLDDAIYRRNRTVEDKLNVIIKISEKTWDEALTAIQSQILSGDSEYDICFDELGTIAKAYEKNMYTDANTISSLDFSNPWWNSAAMDSIRIGESTYYMFGDIHLMLYECYAPIVFNKNMMNAYKLDNLYDVVWQQKWTLDKMNEYMTAVSSDLNGNSKIDAEDQFGLALYSWNSLCFYTGSNTSLVKKDSQGIPAYNGMTEKFTNTYDKITKNIFENKKFVINNDTNNISKFENGIISKYINGETLFLIEPIGSMKQLRNVDFELGIIPLPKYDEEQENYESYILNSPSVLVIPITNSKLEQTGTIIENLCAESHKSVKPTYFDVTLDFKYVQDNQSAKMLDIIFENGSFDLSVVYGWANLSNTLIDLTIKSKTDSVSKITSLEDKLLSEIAVTVDLY